MSTNLSASAKRAQRSGFTTTSRCNKYFYFLNQSKIWKIRCQDLSPQDSSNISSIMAAEISMEDKKPASRFYIVGL